MSDHDYVPKRAPGMSSNEAKRYLSRRHHPKIEEGQDYQSMVEKHGRPFGPFDKERTLPYRGGMNE